MNVVNPWFVIAAESYGRQLFISKFASEKPDIKAIEVPESLENRISDLVFRSPLINSGCMFKSGNPNFYQRAFLQGAGGIVFETITPNPRKGNIVKGIRWPFLRLPETGIAINFMGLLNDGAKANAKRLESLPNYENFPIGVNIAADPEESYFDIKMADLTTSMRLFEKAGADFIK